MTIVMASRAQLERRAAEQVMRLAASIRHVAVSTAGAVPRVHHTTDEALSANREAELGRGGSEVTGEPADSSHVASAVEREAFRAQTGRTEGDEDRTSFLQRGVAAEWRLHSSREAGEIFDAITGPALVDVGYEEDCSWITTLGA